MPVTILYMKELRSIAEFFLVMEELRPSFFLVALGPTEKSGRWRVLPPLWG